MQIYKNKMRKQEVVNNFMKFFKKYNRSSDNQCFSDGLIWKKFSKVATIRDCQEYVAQFMEGVIKNSTDGFTYEGFDKDTNTITVKATLVCAASLDEETAYTIVSTIFENADAIAELHGKGAELDLEFATEGIAVPFHAGAAKYFEEKGITVDTEWSALNVTYTVQASADAGACLRV